MHIPRQRDKLSTNYSRQFHSEKSDALSPSVATTGNQTATLAVTGKSNHQTQGKVQAQGNLSRGKCQFCGSGFHNRRSCRARNDVCHQRGKSGHWQVVCRSQAAAVYGDEESIVASVLCAVPSKSNSFYASVCVNERSDIKALIDPGSTDSFIRANLAKEVDLNITRNSSTTLLADGKPVKLIGYATASLVMCGQEYDVQFKVIQSLVTPVIIGNDVLAEHEVVEFRPGGTKDKLTLCASSRFCASTVFPTMSIDPPVIFSERLWAGSLQLSPNRVDVLLRTCIL